MGFIYFLFWTLFILALRFSISTVFLILSSAGVNIFDLAQTCIPLFKDLVLSICAIVTAFFGARGLYTWRNKMVGESKFEAAKTMMAKSITLRRLYLEARMPSPHLYIFSSSVSQMRNESDRINEFFDKNKDSILGCKKELENKIEQVKIAFDDLLQYSSIANALFGDIISDCLNELNVEIAILERNSLRFFIPIDTFINAGDILESIFLDSVDYILEYPKPNDEPDRFLIIIKRLLSTLQPSLKE